MKRSLLISAAMLAMACSATATADVNVGIALGVPGVIVGVPRIVAPRPYYYPPGDEGYAPVVVVPAPRPVYGWRSHYDHDRRHWRGDHDQHGDRARDWRDHRQWHHDGEGDEN